MLTIKASQTKGICCQYHRKDFNLCKF